MQLLSPLKTSVSHIYKTNLVGVITCTTELFLLKSVLVFFHLKSIKFFLYLKILVIFFGEIILYCKWILSGAVKSKRINMCINNNFKTQNYNFFNDLQYKKNSGQGKLLSAEEMRCPENVTFYLKEYVKLSYMEIGIRGRLQSLEYRQHKQWNIGV